MRKRIGFEQVPSQFAQRKIRPGNPLCLDRIFLRFEYQNRAEKR